MGLPRSKFPLFEKGIFKAFFWDQDDADEFGTKPTGHTVDHLNLSLAGGEQAISSLEELFAMPRDEEILYIPYLHYMNIVNPSAGMITGSSALVTCCLKKMAAYRCPLMCVSPKPSRTCLGKMWNGSHVSRRFITLLVVMTNATPVLSSCRASYACTGLRFHTPIAHIKTI